MYAHRNDEGDITSLYAAPQPGHAEEEVKPDAKEVIDFYEKANKSESNV